MQELTTIRRKKYFFCDINNNLFNQSYLDQL
jgi:hypothetical protein